MSLTLVMLLIFAALILAIVGFWKAPCTNVATLLLAIVLVLVTYK